MRKPKSLRDLLRSSSDAELLWKFQTADPELQGPIASELGRRKCKEAVPSLRARLSAADARMREAAAEALGRIGDPSAGDDLLALFEDYTQPEAVRDTCAFALGHMRFERAMNALVSALTDSSRTVRICAAAALAAIRRGEAREDLELISLVEQDSEVREAMKRAAASLDGRAQRARFPAPPAAEPDREQAFALTPPPSNVGALAPPRLATPGKMEQLKPPTETQDVNEQQEVPESIRSVEVPRGQPTPTCALPKIFNDLPKAAA